MNRALENAVRHVQAELARRARDYGRDPTPVSSSLTRAGRLVTRGSQSSSVHARPASTSGTESTSRPSH
jgi:hypothetical protein